MRTEPVMDIEDELTKLRKENDDLRDRLLSVVRGAKDERERLHAQIVHMQKRIEELEGALKAKLLEHVSKHGH